MLPQDLFSYCYAIVNFISSLLLFSGFSFVGGWLNIVTLILLVIHFFVANTWCFDAHWRLTLLALSSFCYMVQFIYEYDHSKSTDMHVKHYALVIWGLFLFFSSFITMILLVLFPLPPISLLNGHFKNVGTISFHLDVSLPQNAQLYQNHSTYHAYVQCWFPKKETSSKSYFNIILRMLRIFGCRKAVLWTSGNPLSEHTESRSLLEYTATDSGLPKFLFSHLALAQSNSEFMDINSTDFFDEKKYKKFPVVIYSHGMYAWRQIASTTCEMLASNGIVVFSMDHLPSAMVTRPYNVLLEPVKNPYHHSDMKYDYYLPPHIHVGSAAERSFYHGGVDRRAREIMALIDFLETATNANDNANDNANTIMKTESNSGIESIPATTVPLLSRLDQQTSFSTSSLPGNSDRADLRKLIRKLNIDITKLHIFGHSYGGGTCAAVACRDKRVQSCVMLDSWMYPLHDNDRESGSANADLVFISSELWDKSRYQAPYRKDLCSKTNGKLKAKGGGGIKTYQLTIRQSDHQNYCETYLLVNSLLLKKENFLGPIDHMLCAEAYQQIMLRYFNQVNENIDYCAKDISTKDISRKDYGSADNKSDVSRLLEFINIEKESYGSVNCFEDVNTKDINDVKDVTDLGDASPSSEDTGCDMDVYMHMKETERYPLESTRNEVERFIVENIVDEVSLPHCFDYSYFNAA